MKNEEKTYDVAISFAEEDSEIVEDIKKACEMKGLKVFFYKDERAQNWGGNIFSMILDRYRHAALFSLLVVSEKYKEKWWTKIESMIVMAAAQETATPYMLPLRINEAILEGMPQHTIYEDWKNNPEEIAELISSKVQIVKAKAIAGDQNPDSKNKSNVTINNQGDNNKTIGHIDKVDTLNM